MIEVKSISALVADISISFASLAEGVLTGGIFTQSSLSAEFESIDADIAALRARVNALIAIVDQAGRTLAYPQQLVKVVSFSASIHVTGVDARFTTVFTVLQTTACIFAAALTFLEEEAQAALVTSILTCDPTGSAIIEQAVLAYGIPLNCLVIETLDRINEKLGQ